MSRPVNLPAEVPRRLWRGTTGRSTPLQDRNLDTAEDRKRRDALKQMQESLEEQGLLSKRMVNNRRDSSSNLGDDCSLQSGVAGRLVRRADPTLLRRGVYIHDARNHWSDPSHKSERRQVNVAERHGVAGDIEYDASVDQYRPSSQLSYASQTCGFTDAERMVLRALSSTPQPKPLKFLSAPRHRDLPSIHHPSPVAGAGGAAYVPEQKPLVQVYHERLKRVEDHQQLRSASSSMRDTMRSHIADATVNMFGQRHAPFSSHAGIQAPRDCAANILHGNPKNLAGHHPMVDSSSEAPVRKKSRSLQWKQERFAREDFINERREQVLSKEKAIEATKMQRSASRSRGPLDRDADSFMRRSNGLRVNHDSPVASTKSHIASWLFDYPVKQQQYRLHHPGHRGAGPGQQL